MTTVDAAADTPPPDMFRKTKWSVIWLLTLTLFSALTVGGLLAPLQEAAKLDLGMTDIQLALIVGTATAIPTAISPTPTAAIAPVSTKMSKTCIISSRST